MVLTSCLSAGKGIGRRGLVNRRVQGPCSPRPAWSWRRKTPNGCNDDHSLAFPWVVRIDVHRFSFRQNHGMETLRRDVKPHRGLGRIHTLSREDLNLWEFNAPTLGP